MSDTTLQSVLDEITALKAEVAALTDAQSGLSFRLDMIELRMDGVEGQASGLETRLDTMPAAPAEATAPATSTGSPDAERRMDGLELKIEIVDDKVVAVQQIVTEHENRLNLNETRASDYGPRLDQLRYVQGELDNRFGGIEARLSNLETP